MGTEIEALSYFSTAALADKRIVMASQLDLAGLWELRKKQRRHRKTKDAVAQKFQALDYRRWRGASPWHSHV